MASAKLQKPTNQTSSHSNEEHNLGKKITEMTAKVFGHKQHDHREVAKHCSTCQCPAAQKNTMPVSQDQAQKKEHVTTTSAAKHTNCIELRKDKQQAKIPTTKGNTANANNTLIKKEHKEKQVGHYFSNMTDHLKEKIIMMKKTKYSKSKYSSSSDSDSDSCSEDDVDGEKKKNRRHDKETKPASK